MYLTKQKVEELRKEKQEIEQLLPQKYEIDDKINEEKLNIEQEEKTLKFMQEIEKIQNEENLDKEKIKIHIKAKEDLIKNKQELEESINNIKSSEDKKNSNSKLYIIPILIVILSIVLFVMFNKIARNNWSFCLSYSFHRNFNKKYKFKQKI